jgi:hypothetical protein
MTTETEAAIDAALALNHLKDNHADLLRRSGKDTTEKLRKMYNNFKFKKTSA